MNRGAKAALRWWVANAVSWIAFGDAEPRPPEDQCSRRWPFDPPDELLPALRARAERRPWRPERPPVQPPVRRPRLYRAVARRLAREPGADAATLADHLAADLARMESHRTALENALTELVRAIAGGRIEAWAVRCNAAGEPIGDGVAVPIEPAVFYNGDRTISPDGMVEPAPDADGNTALGDILRPRGPYYRGVTFDAAEVRRVWPQNPAGTAPETSQSYRTGAEGRPSSKNLVVAQYERRTAVGNRGPSLRSDAEALRAWLCDTHPEAPPMTIGTIENRIRRLRREGQPKPTK